MLNQIHLGKWEDVMDDIPNSSVDVIITSPPYNVSLGVGNKHKKDSYDSYDDDMPYGDYLRWMTKLFIRCNIVLKRGGRLCINIGDGANGSVPTHVDFTYRLLNLFDEYYTGDHFKMMTTILWDKNQIGASTAWGSWKSPSQPSFPTQFEYIIVVGKGTTKHEGDPEKITVSKEEFIRNSRALWKFPPETSMMRDYDHPAMFPEELPRRLLQQLSYEDDVVLDPFSGAGTTCAVAKKMGRKFIGIEMSEKYHSRSLKRINQIPDMAKVMSKSGKMVSLPEWMT